MGTPWAPNPSKWTPEMGAHADAVVNAGRQAFKGTDAQWAAFVDATDFYHNRKPDAGTQAPDISGDGGTASPAVPPNPAGTNGIPPKTDAAVDDGSGDSPAVRAYKAEQARLQAERDAAAAEREKAAAGQRSYYPSRELSTDSTEFKVSQLPVVGPLLGPLFAPNVNPSFFYDLPGKTPEQNDAAFTAARETAKRQGEQLIRQRDTQGVESIPGAAAGAAAAVTHGLSNAAFGVPEQLANVVMPGAGTQVAGAASAYPKTELASDVGAALSKGSPVGALAEGVSKAAGAGKSAVRALGAAATTGAAASGLSSAVQAASEAAQGKEQTQTPSDALARAGESGLGAAALFLPMYGLARLGGSAVRHMRERPGGEDLVNAEAAGVRTRPAPVPVSAPPAVREAQEVQSRTGEPAQDRTLRVAAAELGKALEGVRSSTVGKIHGETEAYANSPQGQTMVDISPVTSKLQDIITRYTDAEGRPLLNHEQIVADAKSLLAKATESLEPPPPVGGLEGKIRQTPAEAERVAAAAEQQVPREVNVKQLEDIAKSFDDVYGKYTGKTEKQVGEEIASALRGLRSRYGPNDVAPEGYEALRKGHHAARTQMESTLQAFGLDKNVSPVDAGVQAQLQAIMGAIKKGGQSAEQIQAAIEQNPEVKTALENALGHAAYDRMFGTGHGVNAAITEAGKPHAYMSGGDRLLYALDSLMRPAAGVTQYPAIANMPAPAAVAAPRAGILGPLPWSNLLPRQQQQ